ncbi:MAG TPA: YbaK/EbsC family protein, partial [Sphingomonadales bacterium]|nr:YbaK/EbsC family protein [Sphingomonadales bacterium]
PRLLQGLLGVAPGAVTPFAVINLPKDASPFAKTFAVALDQDLLEEERVYFHPLHNEATVGVAPADLLKFLRAFGLKPRLVAV